MSATGESLGAAEVATKIELYERTYGRTSRSTRAQRLCVSFMALMYAIRLPKLAEKPWLVRLLTPLIGKLRLVRVLKPLTEAAEAVEASERCRVWWHQLYDDRTYSSPERQHQTSIRSQQVARRPRSRERCTHRARRLTRTSSRSGDSGDDGPGEPPPATSRLTFARIPTGVSA